MQIGAVSAASGVSVRMVRHYEGIGLIPPPVRLPGGHRRYDEGAVHRLRFIAAARDVGLPFEEIRSALALWGEGAGPPDEVRAAARSLADALAERGAALAIVRQALIDLARSADEPDRPRHPVIPERTAHAAGVSNRDDGRS